MPKLNETTNDKMKKKAAKAIAEGGIIAATPNGKMHIVEAHEPLKDELPPLPPLPQIQPMPPLPVFPVLTHTISAPVGVPGPAPTAEPQPLKVALVGTAPSSRMLAPFNDPSWKIWGCSPGNQGILPRIDMWFELHGNLLWPEHKHYGEPYIKWLKEQKFPIYMQDQSLVPHALVFPHKELVKEFGPSFFTSSFSWMMAFAINQGAKEIALFGIDMASRDEYILQRPGFYFFKHIAEKKGIKVSAPNESDIMMPPGLYGYSDITPFGRKLHARRKEIKDRIAQMEAQMKQVSDSLIYLKGADEDIDYTMSIWMGAQDNSPEK